MVEVVSLLGAAAAGTVVGAMVSLVPALYVYNVAALLLLAPAALGERVPPELSAFSFIGMTTGYAMSNAVSGIFFSAPDDSTIFVVLPGQKYLLQKRGYEAVMLTGIGGLGGIAALAPLTPVPRPCSRHCGPSYNPTCTGSCGASSPTCCYPNGPKAPAAHRQACAAGGMVGRA